MAACVSAVPESRRCFQHHVMLTSGVMLIVFQALSSHSSTWKDCLVSSGPNKKLQWHNSLPARSPIPLLVKLDPRQSNFAHVLSC